MTQAASHTAPSDAPRAFSPEELSTFKRSFAEAGYLVFRDIVPKEKLSALRTTIVDEFERTKRSGALFSGGGVITGHLNCYPGEAARFVHDALRDRGILDVLRAIATRPIEPFYVGCNLNLPGSVAQHYHADGLFTESFIVANTAVVDTDLVNGAIDVLPGTHKEFHKYWRFALERRYRQSTRISMSQGDVLLRSSTLWHRGMPNHSAAPRPMVALTFGENRGPVLHDDPFRMNGGKIEFQANWYKTDLLGRLRERTFAAAPITYSAYRFVRSLVGNKGYATW